MFLGTHAPVRRCFFFQAEDGIRYVAVTGVQTCALPILVIDNGQHVFLRCCSAYRGLLARLGMTGAVSLQDRFDVTVLGPGGRARLRRTGLPGPLHMGQALAGYSFLSP